MTLTRTIERKIEFSIAEVRDALIVFLDKNSHATPPDATNCVITLGAHGAVLQWDEQHKDVVLV
jgi:hypothetical protein